MLAPDKYTKEYEVHRCALLRSLIPPGRGARALDLGSGPGFFSCELTKMAWKVTAVDGDPDDIALAGRHVERAIQGDAIAVLRELREERFDLVLCLELIEHLPPESGAELLERIRHVTRDGGCLLISTPNRFSPEGLGNYYWGEKLRGWAKWDAWDETHTKIYSSFEFLRLLRRNGWEPQQVVGYWYRGVLPMGIKWSMPFLSSRRFPFNRFGFNLITSCQPR